MLFYSFKNQEQKSIFNIQWQLGQIYYSGVYQLNFAIFSPFFPATQSNPSVYLHIPLLPAVLLESVSRAEVPLTPVVSAGLCVYVCYFSLLFLCDYFMLNLWTIC